MNKQVKLIDAEKVFDWANDNVCTLDFVRLHKAFKNGEFDPIPPTIKLSESHVCPKCSKVNVFNTPIDDINVAWLMCSYCHRSSETEEWMEVSHD